VTQTQLQDPVWVHTYSMLEDARLAAAQPDPDRDILVEQTLRLCEDAIDAHCRRFCPDQTKRLKTVLRKRFVEGLTLERIARSLWITRERVRQLELKILSLARKRISGRNGGGKADWRQQ
jgi:DNA-directed RNA polymerase sigma subunit (sigma70/sigma32)